jgi:hypothetical protein
LRHMSVLPLHGWASATEPVELVQRGAERVGKHRYLTAELGLISVG